MGHNPLVQAVSLLGITVVALAAHEVMHLLVARAYGYHPICWGISPQYFGIVFRDQPIRSYRLLQVMLPLVATALVIHYGFFVLPPTRNLFRFILPELLPLQLTISSILALATSSADISAMIGDLRRPIAEPTRIARDMELLLRQSSLVRFTAFGQLFVKNEFGMSHAEYIKCAMEGRLTAGNCEGGYQHKSAFDRYRSKADDSRSGNRGSRPTIPLTRQ